MLEKEAKEKTCHLTIGSGDYRKCLTSNCMAWKFYETQEFRHRANSEFKKSGRRLEIENGYCGLTEKPADVI